MSSTHIFALPIIIILSINAIATKYGTGLNAIIDDPNGQYDSAHLSITIDSITDEVEILIVRELGSNSASSNSSILSDVPQSWLGIGFSENTSYVRGHPGVYSIIADADGFFGEDSSLNNTNKVQEYTLSTRSRGSVYTVPEIRVTSDIYSESGRNVTIIRPRNGTFSFPLFPDQLDDNNQYQMHVISAFGEGGDYSLFSHGTDSYARKEANITFAPLPETTTNSPTFTTTTKPAITTAKPVTTIKPITTAATPITTISAPIRTNASTTTAPKVTTNAPTTTVSFFSTTKEGSPVSTAEPLTTSNSATTAKPTKTTVPQVNITPTASIATTVAPTTSIPVTTIKPTTTTVPPVITTTVNPITTAAAPITTIKPVTTISIPIPTSTTTEPEITTNTDGTVNLPSTTSTLQHSGTTTKSTTINPPTTTTTPAAAKKVSGTENSLHLNAIIGIVVAVLFVIMMIILGVIWCRTKKTKKNAYKKVEKQHLKNTEVYHSVGTTIGVPPDEDDEKETFIEVTRL